MVVGSIMSAGLTTRELSLFAAAFASIKNTDRNVDWEKFTQLAGYGSVNSARVCFRPVLKKLDTFVANGPSSVADGPKAPRAKKSNHKGGSVPTRPGLHKKRKLDDDEAVNEGAHARPKVKPEPDCGQNSCAQPLVVPAETKSGSIGTSTGSSPEASRLAPASCPTPVHQPASNTHNVVESTMPTGSKPVVVKMEDDGPTQQLTREVTAKTEEVEKPSSLDDLRSIRSKTVPSEIEEDVKSIDGCSTDLGAASVSTATAGHFHDQSFSYGRSLDFGFDDFEDQEDVI